MIALNWGKNRNGELQLSHRWRNADGSKAKTIKIKQKNRRHDVYHRSRAGHCEEKAAVGYCLYCSNKGAGQTLNMPEGPQHTSETPFASAPLVGAGQELNMPKGPQHTSEPPVASAPGANIAQRNGGVKAKTAEKRADRPGRPANAGAGARNYAIREAQKATYRDASAVANALKPLLASERWEHRFSPRA